MRGLKAHYINYLEVTAFNLYWLLYGLELLNKHNPQKHYVEHARKIVLAIVEAQNVENVDDDVVGSWGGNPRSTPAATRVEGLMAAYRMFQRIGDEEMLMKIFETSQRSIRFQLVTQFRPESVMYLPDPVRALGGFREGLTGYEICIDFVQHNVSAMLGFLEILKKTTH